MLRIAVQSKGRLYDETMMLLEEAGIKLNRGKRILLLSAKGFPVEVLFLRDDDIPQSVANGVQCSFYKYWKSIIYFSYPFTFISLSYYI